VSRKRAQQRENKKELARQLGVAGRAVPQNLLENERVTEPELDVSGAVTAWPGGILGRLGLGAPSSRELQLHALLWCVSAHRARLVRSLRLAATVTGAGPIAFTRQAASSHDHDVVRYKRPGFFVLLVGLSEGRGEAGAVVDAEHLTHRDALDVGGGPRSLVDLAGVTTPTAVPLTIAGLWGGLVVARAAADRVKEQLALPPLASPDGKAKVTLTVNLRL
jgi:hypothetical protein